MYASYLTTLYNEHIRDGDRRAREGGKEAPLPELNAVRPYREEEGKPLGI